MELLVVFILIFERLRMTNLMCSAWLRSLSDRLSQKRVKFKFVSFGVNLPIYMRAICKESIRVFYSNVGGV